jgi:hypothetical protein
MLEPPKLKALKTIDFAFCLCSYFYKNKNKAFKRAKVLETGKKANIKKQ